MNASAQNLSQSSSCNEGTFCAGMESAETRNAQSPRAMSLVFDSSVQVEQFNTSIPNTPGSSSLALDTVAQRLKKLHLFPKEIAEDYSLPALSAFSDIQIPTIDFTDVQAILGSVRGAEGDKNACFQLQLPVNPLGAAATEAKPEGVCRHREGKLFLQVQSLQLVQTASNAKRLENGTVVFLGSLGGSVYECTSSAIELGDRIVAFPNANAALGANNAHSSALTGSQLHVHQSCCLEVPGEEHDTLTISLLFQNQASPSTGFSLAKSLRGKMQQFIAKRKGSVSASSLRSASSTLSCRSTASNASMLFGGEFIVAQSEISLHEARYSEIFGGKLIEMEVRFEGNSWVQSLKLCCCFVPLQDSLGPLRTFPQALNEAVQMSELRAIASSVSQQGIVQCKSKSQPWWKRQIALLRGSMLILYVEKIATASGGVKGWQVDRVLDLGSAFAVSGFNSERTSMMPRSFRIWMRGPAENVEAGEWIDFVATSRVEYNCWVGNLKRVLRVFAVGK